MKILLPLFLLTLSFSAFAHTSDACKFRVNPASPDLGEYGYITVGQRTASAGFDEGEDLNVYRIDEVDVQGINSMKLFLWGYFSELLSVDFSTTKSARQIQLITAKNPDKFPGATITTFYDDQNNIIAKIGQIGNKIGVCEAEWELAFASKSTRIEG